MNWHTLQNIWYSSLLRGQGQHWWEGSFGLHCWLYYLERCYLWRWHLSLLWKVWCIQQYDRQRWTWVCHWFSMSVDNICFCYLFLWQGFGLLQISKRHFNANKWGIFPKKQLQDILPRSKISFSIKLYEKCSKIRWRTCSKSYKFW